MTEPATPQDPTVTRLPDGSAFMTAQLPLPSDHWLYYKPEPFTLDAPPMTMLAPSNHPLRQAMTPKVREALRYALRVTTCNGKYLDFDPDALEQNLLVGLFGYATDDGLSESEWANGKDAMTIEELHTAPGDRWSRKYESTQERESTAESGSD